MGCCHFVFQLVKHMQQDHAVCAATHPDKDMRLAGNLQRVHGFFDGLLKVIYHKVSVALNTLTCWLLINGADFYFCALNVLGMKSIYSVSLFVILFSIASCKQEAKQNEAVVTETNQPDSTRINPTAASDSIAKMNAGHDYTFLTHQVFKINGAYVPGKKPEEQPYKDQWVDLKEDGTFSWGKGKDVLYSGNWGYNHDQMILQLNPDNSSEQQSQWSVKYNDQMMIWVGTNNSANHGVQMQLFRTPEI